MAEQHTKPWHKCPECGSATLLYCKPHEHAGIWECQNPACGASDSCDHEDTETKQDWVYYPTPQQIDQGTDHDELVTWQECLDCGVEIEDI